MRNLLSGTVMPAKAGIHDKIRAKALFVAMLALFLSACTTSEVKLAKKQGVDWQDLLIESANSGEPAAEYAMARLSCCASERMQDTVEWLCAAASENFPQAFFDLGRIYSLTYPADYYVKPSNTMALTFYNLAEKHGFDAPHVLHNYRHKAISGMTNTDIEYAGELVSKWPNIPCGVHKKRVPLDGR